MWVHLRPCATRRRAISSAPTPMRAPLQCQQTGMYLEVTGFEKDFEMRFESLQKKFRTGQAGADIKEGEHSGDILCIYFFLVLNTFDV